MKEMLFPLAATAVGLAYVLTYAWAQLEVLASALTFWKERRYLPSVALMLLLAGMNCFEFLLAHEVHFDVIRERRLVLFEIESLWAKGSAVLVILVHWVWVIGSFCFAVRRSRRMRAAAAEETAAP
jgi:hypothetical protein